MSGSLLPIYNFSTIVFKPLTRTFSACDCLICQIGKLKLNKKHPLGQKEPKSLNKENLLSQDLLQVLTFSQNKKKSTQCLSVIAQGFRHSCTIGTKQQNLQALVQSDPVGAKQIASAIISSKDASPGGPVCLSQSRGEHLFSLTPGNYTSA